MMKAIMTMSVVLGLILTGGCGDSKPAVAPEVGTYEMDLQVFRDAILKGSEGKEPNSMQKNLLQRVDQMSGALVLNEDGTCLMTLMDGPQSTEDAGKWRVVGQKLFLDGKDRASGELVTSELSLVDGVATLVTGPGPDGTRVFRKVEKK